jgi:hypothetical protein
MTTKTTIKNLATWIEDIKEAAKDDNCFSVAFFKDTEHEPFAIVAGWQKMFREDYSDLFCVSKSHPEYVMCVKIVTNDGQGCPDFEALNMPTDKFGEVDDTCIPLEWDDPSEVAAQFFLMEWERIMDEHREEKI